MAIFGTRGLLLAALVLAAGGCFGVARGQPLDVGQGIEARVEDVSRRLTANPSNAALLLERAELYHEARRWEEMIRDLDEVIRLTPRDATALAMRGLARGAIHHYDQAFEDVDKALAIKPNWAGLLALRGSLLLNTGRPREAIDWLTRSIDDAPSGQAYFDRAYCHRLLGDRSKAIDDYTAAIALDASLVAAVCERGHMYQTVGDFSRAIDDLEFCRKQRPDDPQASLSLAWILATCPDPARRSGHKALLIARGLCDPVTCQTIEPLSALAAAYAEVGQFAKAEALQKRAVALSYFAPEFHEVCVDRLETIRKHEPIRDAATPLVILPRVPQDGPRVVTEDEALAAPADVLALNYLATRHLQSLCSLVRAGARVTSWLDGQPLEVSEANVARVEERLRERMQTYTQVVHRRGFARLQPGYTSTLDGGCQEWGIADQPVLVEQDGCNVYLSQGDMRHLGVVVESTVALRHEASTDIMITGRVSADAIVFATPPQGGIMGTAEQRCLWRLEPAAVEGPDWAGAFLGRALAHRAYGEHAAMVADLERSLDMKPDAAVAALEAFVLATCPDARVRDGARAVELAERAKTLAGQDANMWVFVSLAAAHAEAGDFRTAMMYQKRAIERAPEEEKPELQEHLRVLQSGKPIRTEPPFN